MTVHDCIKLHNSGNVQRSQVFAGRSEFWIGWAFISLCRNALMLGWLIRNCDGGRSRIMVRIRIQQINNNNRRRCNQNVEIIINATTQSTTISMEQHLKATEHTYNARIVIFMYIYIYRLYSIRHFDNEQRTICVSESNGILNRNRWRKSDKRTDSSFAQINVKRLNDCCCDVVRCHRVHTLDTLDRNEAIGIYRMTIIITNTTVCVHESRLRTLAENKQ